MHRICGRSSSGRAPPCQGGGSEFEPRRPLHRERNITPVLVAWPSGKAKVCKTFIHQFKSGRHLQNSPGLRSGAFCFYLCKHKTRPGMLSTSPVLFIPRYNSSCPFPSSDPMPCPPVSVHRPASPLLLPGSAPPKYWSAAGPALHRLPHISQPIYHRNGYNFTCAVSFVATTPPTCYNGSITP